MTTSAQLKMQPDDPRHFAKEHRYEHRYTATCFCCGARTAYADFLDACSQGYLVANCHLDYRRYPELTHYVPTPEEEAAAEDAYDRMLQRALFTVGQSMQHRQTLRRLDAQGHVYWLTTDITTTELHQVCAACFAMEPALAEAVEQGWRFTKVDVRQRCRCGRLIPCRLISDLCVFCHRQYRMLDMRLAVARDNRRLVTQLRAALRQEPGHE
jgi:hypothetical protein